MVVFKKLSADQQQNHGRTFWPVSQFIRSGRIYFCPMKKIYWNPQLTRIPNADKDFNKKLSGNKYILSFDFTKKQEVPARDASNLRWLAQLTPFIHKFIIKKNAKSLWLIDF